MSSVHSLYVIYDADGTVTGEVVYMVKKLLGLGHCAACDITHGARREKPEFTQLKRVWPVPVRNIHRDEMDARMRRAVAARLPCVVARTDAADARVLGPDALDRCRGDVVAFAHAVLAAVQRAGLRMPATPPPPPPPPHKERMDGALPFEKGRASVDDCGSVVSSGDAVVPACPF